MADHYSINIKPPLTRPGGESDWEFGEVRASTDEEAIKVVEENEVVWARKKGRPTEIWLFGGERLVKKWSVRP